MVQEKWWRRMYISLMVVGCTFIGTNAQSQQLKWGLLEIHPGLAIQETFDDNIFLQETREVDDFITSIKPSLDFVLPLREHRFSIGSTIEILRFADNDNENTENYTVFANMALTFPVGLRIALTERYADTSEPSSSQSQSATGDPRTPRRQNDFGFGVGYAFNPKTEIELLYSRTDHIYDREANERLNRNKNTITVTGFRRILPKTSMLLSYGFLFTNYIEPAPDFDKDNREHRVSIGLRFDPTAKLRGTLSVGYIHQIFESRRADNEQTISAATELTWAATQRTLIDLLVSRDIRQSDTQGASSFYATLFELGVNQRLPFEDKMSLSLRGSYERDDFNNLDRGDDIFRATVQISYDVLKWLRLWASYGVTDKSSDEPTVEYTVNRFSLGARGRL